MKITRLHTLVAVLLMVGCHGFKPSHPIGDMEMV